MAISPGSSKEGWTFYDSSHHTSWGIGILCLLEARPIGVLPHLRGQLLPEGARLRHLPLTPAHPKSVPCMPYAALTPYQEGPLPPAAREDHWGCNRTNKNLGDQLLRPSKQATATKTPSKTLVSPRKSNNFLLLTSMQTRQLFTPGKCGTDNFFTPSQNAVGSFHANGQLPHPAPFARASINTPRLREGACERSEARGGREDSPCARHPTGIASAA